MVEHTLRKISKEKFTEIVKNSKCWADVMEACCFSRKGNTRGIKKRVNNWSLDVSHFLTGKTLIKKYTCKMDIDALREKLIEDCYHSTDGFKKQLFRFGLLEEKCYKCGLGPEWDGARLVLQLDHINGTNCDNRLENLRILCPNCHSQTDTYVGKKCKKDSKKCPDCGINIKRQSDRCISCYREFVKNNKITRQSIKNKCGCGKSITRKSKQCKDCAIKSLHIVDRPEECDLLTDISAVGFEPTGKKYKVTGNTIRKWCITYGLPSNTTELKEFLQNLDS